MLLQVHHKSTLFGHGRTNIAFSHSCNQKSSCYSPAARNPSTAPGPTGSPARYAPAPCLPTHTTPRLLAATNPFLDNPEASLPHTAPLRRTDHVSVQLPSVQLPSRNHTRPRYFSTTPQIAPLLQLSNTRQQLCRLHGANRTAASTPLRRTCTRTRSRSVRRPSSCCITVVQLRLQVVPDHALLALLPKLHRDTAPRRDPIRTTDTHMHAFSLLMQPGRLSAFRHGSATPPPAARCWQAPGAPSPAHCQSLAPGSTF